MRTTSLKSRALKALLCCAAPIVLSCSQAEPAQESTAASAEAASNAAGTEQGSAASAAVAPPPGSVTLKVRYEPRLKVLRALAEQHGFKILGKLPEPSKIDLELEGVSLEQAVAAILEGYAYALQYDLTEEGKHTVGAVLLGSTDRHLQTLRFAQMRERLGGDRAAKKQERARLKAMEPEERELVLAERRREAEEKRARRAAEQEQYVADLDAADADLRVTALSRLESSRVGLSRLEDLALRDKDPRVRREAVAHLGDSADPQARDAVRAALDDASIDVVIEALDAIGFSPTKADIPYVHAMMNHADPEIAGVAFEVNEVMQVELAE